jgi:hypothetical protein
MRRQLTNVAAVKIGTVRVEIVPGRANGSSLAHGGARQRSGGALMICHHGPAKTSTQSILQSSAFSRIASTIALTLVATAMGCGGSVAAKQGSGDNPGSGSSSGGGADDAGESTGDAGTATDASKATDANGAASEMYPAFQVDVAQVVDNGGPVLAAPVIVAITWSSDPDAETYNAMVDAIGATAYWKDINSEYGVGPATSGAANHVSITTAAPATYADTDLDALVEAQAGVTWPAPTVNTIYAVFLPPGTSITLQGQDACQAGVGGYHTESQNKNLVYGIMPHCPMFQTSDVELGASHELNEAATDPHPGTHTAYAGFDQDHLAFEFFNQFQDELGDACEAYVEATDTTDMTPYTVQRQWSNKSAAAGSHWCLPKLNEPMYNTTFLPTTNLDTISVNLNPLYPGAGTQTSKGIKMAAGTTRTFPIGLFSDEATSGPFTLDVQGLTTPIAQDQNGNNINNGTMTVTIDMTSGVNGQIANVTVAPTSFSTLGVNFFYIRSVLPGAQQHHYLPVLVSAN